MRARRLITMNVSILLALGGCAVAPAAEDTDISENLEGHGCDQDPFHDAFHHMFADAPAPGDVAASEDPRPVRVLALTFQGAPYRPEDLEAIVEALDEAAVPGNFFLAADHIEAEAPKSHLDFTAAFAALGQSPSNHLVGTDLLFNQNRYRYVDAEGHADLDAVQADALAVENALGRAGLLTPSGISFTSTPSWGGDCTAMNEIQTGIDRNVIGWHVFANSASSDEDPAAWANKIAHGATGSNNVDFWMRRGLGGAVITIQMGGYTTDEMLTKKRVKALIDELRADHDYAYVFERLDGQSFGPYSELATNGQEEQLSSDFEIEIPDAVDQCATAQEITEGCYNAGALWSDLVSAPFFASETAGDGAGDAPIFLQATIEHERPQDLLIWLARDTDDASWAIDLANPADATGLSMQRLPGMDGAPSRFLIEGFLGRESAPDTYRFIMMDRMPGAGGTLLSWGITAVQASMAPAAASGQ